MMNIKKGWHPLRAFRYYTLRLWRIRGNPFVLSRGVSIGVFIGLTPTIPFHTILILFFCALFRGNVVTALIANWLVSNPFTIPGQYYAAWKLGVMMTGTSISWAEVRELIELLRHEGVLEAARTTLSISPKILLCLLTGGVILALPFALASYFGCLYFYIQRQKRKYEKLLKR